MNHKRVIAIFLKLKMQEIRQSFHGIFLEVITPLLTITGLVFVTGGLIIGGAWCTGKVYVLITSESLTTAQMMEVGAIIMGILCGLVLVGGLIFIFCKWIISNWHEAKRIASREEMQIGKVSK